MRYCAIICEYNPFHSGHLYHMQQALKKSGADGILSLMSGNFVQRAEPAIFDKYVRAQAALTCGADAVLELPTLFATMNGQKFAEGAVRILKDLPFVHYIAIGCEDNNLPLLKAIATIQTHESELFKSHLSLHLAQGLSYASAYTKATVMQAKTEGYDHVMCDIILSKPNNLLCIEYLKAIERFNAPLSPILITRKGNAYNSNFTSGETISATAAREIYRLQKYNELATYIPQNIQKLFEEENKHFFVRTEIYEALLIHALRNNNLNNLYDNGEGIANKLKDNALKYVDLTQILMATKSKRYTFSRLKRLCVQALLLVDKDIIPNSIALPSKLLAVRESFKPLLSLFPKCIMIQNSDYNRLTSEQMKIAEIDKKASNIYSLLTQKSGNSFYNNKLITL